MIRVLLVEDSVTMLHHLRESLALDPELTVVGTAADGAHAVELCGRLRPDVVTMDMMLPTMSGLAATEHIMAEFPTPILVVSSADRRELFSTYNALAAGAVDVLEKPRGDTSDAQWPRRLCSAVRLVSRIRVITHPRARLDARRKVSSALSESSVRPEQTTSTTKTVTSGGATTSERAATPGRATTTAVEAPAPRVICVGASTGGPGAITTLLRALPTGFRTPVLCVQHIAASEPFAVAFSDWLGDQVGRRVSYARDGVGIDELAGQVVLAPPDRHLLVRNGAVALSAMAPRHSCRPSVDVLFESVAEHFGAASAGCLLTGMGRDGAAGLLQLRNSGAVTFAQDEASCIVYGMPREATLIGAAAFVLPPALIAARLGELVSARRLTDHR